MDFFGRCLVLLGSLGVLVLALIRPIPLGIAVPGQELRFFMSMTTDIGLVIAGYVLVQVAKSE